jgi:hypothetical protein
MLLNLFYDWGDLSQWIAGGLLVLFILLYTYFAPWWKHPVGWVVNIFAFSLILILWPSVTYLADPTGFANFATTTWYKVTETLNLTFLVGAAFTGVITWIRLHRQRRLPGEGNGRNKKKA